MKRLKNITILLCFLSLLAFISCSAEDKTGVKNNPPEDTEITDGETGSGGTGSSSGGSSGTEEGGSEEGEGGTETPPTPSEPETPPSDGIEEGDFPPPEGKYRYDSRALQNYRGSSFEPKVSYIAGEKTQIEGTLIIHGSDEEDGDYRGGFLELTVSKWKKTTKGGKITKTEAVEIEGKKILMAGRNETPTFSEVIYDYETKTLSITCKVTTKDGIKKTLSTKSKKY